MMWEKVRLGDVCNVISGFAFKSDDYKSQGIPLLRISNIINEEINFKEDCVCIEESHFENLKKFQVIKNDILIALSGATTGKYGVYKLETPALLNQRVGLIRAKDNLDRNFLLHYFNVLKKDIEYLAQGAAQPNISPSEISNLQIPLPPLPIQKRIAEILDTADALRRKDEALLKKYDELAQAIFIDMFGDPVKNEKGWEVKKLEDILATKSQNGLYITEENYISNGIEMVHMSDAFYQKVSSGNLKKVNISKSELEKYRLTDDSILVARRSLNYEGAAKPCLVDTKGQNLVYESSLIRLNTNKNIILPIYLFYFLSNEKAKKKYVMKYVTKSTISGINNENLNKINVLVPPIDLQKYFKIKVELIEKNINLYTKEKFMSLSLFNSLLQKAFNGELVA